MPESLEQLEGSSQYLLKVYQECLKELGLDESIGLDDLSYNVYVTPRLMFVVERRESSVIGSEDGQKVDLNTLGFVGTIATKNKQSMDFAKEMTPIELLKSVAAQDPEI